MLSVGGREAAALTTGSGIILLALIALIVAYVVARSRRRMGLLVTGKTWIAVVIGVVIVILVLWASQAH